MSPEWRRVLSHRSIDDRIAVAIDCDLADPRDLPTVGELVRAGVLVWTDRAVLRHLGVMNDGKPVMTRTGHIRRPNVDVYRLTSEGIELCDAEGIARR
jgi:hypothetical protein